MSDYKRMELLSLPHSDLIERVLWIESMWKESVEKRDALTATIAEKDAEIEKLREVLRDVYHESNEDRIVEIAGKGLSNSGEIVIRGEP